MGRTTILQTWQQLLTAAGFVELERLLPAGGAAARAAALAGECLA
jgi:hypothetical protein